MALVLLSIGSAAQAQNLTLPPSKPLPSREKVRVTLPARIAVWAPLFVGRVQGEFDKENIDIEYVQARATDALVLLATGKVDVMFGGLAAGIFNAIDQGSDIRIVAPSSINPPESRQGVWVNKSFLAGRPYTPAMLKGQTILTQVGFGSPIIAYIARELNKSGLTLKDITLKQMDGADIPVALENGAVNFAMLTDPFWLSLDRNKTQWVFMNEGDYSTGVILYGPTLLRQKRAVGEAFMRV